MFHDSWKNTYLSHGPDVLDLLDDTGIEYFPPREQVFRAFQLPVEEIKVVVVGQDCYHKRGQAMGLAFSVPRVVKVPPSLRNIYKELYKHNPSEIPAHGDLSGWADQGVLLLNSALTVQEGSPGSHLKLWKKITNNVIEYISKNCNNVVFMLWGGFAKSKSLLIDDNKHKILFANHPSPLSANRGGWWGCDHFKHCNEYLSSHDIDEINWFV